MDSVENHQARIRGQHLDRQRRRDEERERAEISVIVEAMRIILAEAARIEHEGGAL
jgi:hypothetical protein